VSRVFWDTNIFIYLFEGAPHFSSQVFGLRERMIHRGDQLVTSAFTLGELLVKPLRENNETAVAYYQQLLQTTTILIPFDENVAMAYAGLRAQRSLPQPDAIQLASAASYGVDLFVTNDKHLLNRVVPGIQFIVGLDRVPI
jgi:predicted nucleic acid-binding protein